MGEPPRILCDLCSRVIPKYGHYVVKINVYADPSIPPVNLEDLEETDYDSVMAGLLEEMKDATEQELEDAVARQFEFKICRPCQINFLLNPLGRPRRGNSFGDN